MPRPPRLVSLVALAGILILSPGGTAAQTGGLPISSRVLTSSVSTHRVVALTFDDGPSAYSPQILDLLSRYHAHATFFVIGMQAAMDPGQLRQEARAGDLVGDHTFTHADLQALSDSQIDWQLQTTQDAIRSATGKPTHWFRPPYGAVDGRVSSIAAADGLQTVTWSVDPRDWSLPGVGAIVDRVLSAVRPGSVVLMHDGGGDRSESVAALSAILPALTAQGYRMVTLDELFFPWLVSRAAPRCPVEGCRASPVRRARHGKPKQVPAPATPTPVPTPPSCELLKRLPWPSPELTRMCQP